MEKQFWQFIRRPVFSVGVSDRAEVIPDIAQVNALAPDYRLVSAVVLYQFAAGSALLGGDLRTDELPNCPFGEH